VATVDDGERDDGTSFPQLCPPALLRRLVDGAGNGGVLPGGDGVAAGLHGLAALTGVLAATTLEFAPDTVTGHHDPVTTAAAAGSWPESDASTTPGGGTADNQNLYTDPATVFSVNYAADMLPMVLIGGIGTM
jgi:hypothetical protein